MDEGYQKKLHQKAKEYSHLVYKISKNFPREELYGIISQIRRSAISVALNVVEGYARNRPKEQIRFFEIAYASLKESKFLIVFSMDENFSINEVDYDRAMILADELGAMIWGVIQNKKNNS